jgi:large subunit ribosomal protein L22
MKAKKIKNVEIESKARAESKFNIISHIKMNAVAREIRGLEYPVAIAYLKQLPQKGAKIVLKTVKSAYHNLLQVDENAAEDECFVKELNVGTGPNIKRLKPRARGRADIYKKRTSHLEAVVARRSS